MDDARELAINGDRLWASIMDMAHIGATSRGGSNRLALTDDDRAARDLFVAWCRDAGCTITVDRMGSIFARRAGRDAGLAPVVAGSHLDTQPTGGRFDGVFGVLAALEVVRTLNDHACETDRPVEAVVWTNEEGSRFAPSMIASAVFAGKVALHEALAITDPDGLSMGAELARIGYAGEEEVGAHPIHAYFEPHIEQGPILEAEGGTIGVVTSANGMRWYEVMLTGLESHAGTTPMDRRQDALFGAARAVELVNRIGREHAPHGVGTVGMIQAYPNSRNVIPGRAFLTVDFRHPDGHALSAMDRALRAGLDAISVECGLGLDCRQILYNSPVQFDADCVAAVRRAAEAQGQVWREMHSGAGHDACNIAAVAPTAMIFIPCVGGISHNEAEDVKPQWTAAGAQVLLGAVLEAASTRQES